MTDIMGAVEWNKDPVIKAQEITALTHDIQYLRKQAQREGLSSDIRDWYCGMADRVEFRMRQMS